MLRLAPFTEREIRTAVNTTVRLIETAPTKVPPPASSRLPESSKERSVAKWRRLARRKTRLCGARRLVPVSNRWQMVHAPHNVLRHRRFEDGPFYLSEVDDLARYEADQPTIGLILYKSKNQIIAEYAPRDMAKPLGIPEFHHLAQLPEQLEGSLPTIEVLEAELTTPGNPRGGNRHHSAAFDPGRQETQSHKSAADGASGSSVTDVPTFFLLRSQRVTENADASAKIHAAILNPVAHWRANP